MDRAAILETDIEAILELTGLSGSGYGGNLIADLRQAIIQSDQLNYWLRGDICTEIIVRQELPESNGQLNALWEVRFYPTSGGSDTPYIRISHTIENINLSTRGNVNYALSIKQGYTQLSEVYSKPHFQHNNSSRWRKVFWLGEEPPEVEIRFDLPYMISTGMILPYDTSLIINESAILSSYNFWHNSDNDIMGNGSIYMYMPGVAGRGDIGMLPTWTAQYLLTMDNRMREVMLSNGEMSGSIPIHYREDDTLNSFYGRTVSIDDRISFNLINYNGPAAIGDTGNTGWHADQAHQPSLVYVPYLITGERWFLDELYYWGGYNLAFDLYHRNTRGDIPGADSSYGLIAGQLRGVAWGLRTLSDAAAIALDSDLEKNYFRSKLINNLSWHAWRNIGANGHGLNAVMWRGTPHTSANWPTQLISPWQHDFMVLTTAHIARQHADMPNAARLRDSIGSFTIDRFIRLPQYAGVSYRMPYNDLQGEYYRNSNWARFAADIAQYTNNEDPKIYFDSQRYSYSYAAIALGASAVVSHLPNGRNTYNFLKDNINYNTWARNDPTWAFVPVR